MKPYIAITYLCVIMTLSCSGMIADAQKGSASDPATVSTTSSGSTGIYSLRGNYLNRWDSTSCLLTLSGSGVTQSSVCGPNGVYLFRNLASGNYTLTATVASGIVSPASQNIVISSDASVNDIYFVHNYWNVTGINSGESIASIVEDSDGYSALGASPVTGKMNDITLVKFNRNGDILFQKYYGGTGDDEGVKIRKTSDGGYLLLCNSVSNTMTLSGLNGRLMKVDAQGNLLWDTIFGGLSYDCVSDFILTSDGSVIICGSSRSFSSNGNSDIYAVKINSSGTLVWSKTYGSSADEYGIAIASVNSSAYIIAGYTNGSDGISPRILVKTIDDAGNETASQIISSMINESLSGMVSLDGNRFAIAAVSSSGVKRDAEILIVTSTLSLESRTSYGSTGNSEFTSIASDGAGGFLAAGYLCKPTGNRDKDFYLVKIAANGTTTYMKIYGDGSDDIARTVSVTSLGIILAGHTISGGTQYTKIISVDDSGVIQ